MKKKFIAIAGVLVFCCGVIWASRQLVGPNGQFFPDKHVTARSKGDSRGDLWIVEYADFQCITCKNSAALIKTYLSKHPSRIYLQFRFHPLIKTHPHALKSAVYADCAVSQGKFWAYHDILFENQDVWSVAQDPEASFREYAGKIGLDIRRLDACVENPETEARVMREKKENVDLGVTATPTFFLNGKMVVGVKELQKELELYFSEKDQVKK